MSNVLVLNCGSSSVKFALINTDSNETLFSGLAENISQKNCCVTFKAEDKQVIHIENGRYDDVFTKVKQYLEETGYLESVIAVGHRVVHGGQYFSGSVIACEDSISKMKECIALAPLHNPANIEGIEFCQRIFPKLPQVAVFDTAFHQTIAKYVSEYAIPRELTDNYHIKKYGFHGTSHQYVSQQAAKLLGKENGNFIVAHLGNGCSLSAVIDGKSVDTSMGFTPLDGLIMGTRSGTIDAGVFGFLAKNLGWNVDKITDVLNKQSGLLGICGENDMRGVEELAFIKNDIHAKQAIEMFCHRVAQFVASYMIYFRSFDGLVFTGGIGENGSTIRSGIISKLQNIGFKVDEQKNSTRGEIFINAKNSYNIMVVQTNEELMIAKETLKFI
jgi:acetate kinase